MLALIDFSIITSCWLLLIAILLVLQKLGYDFGFHVWPIGEVRNWLMFLHDQAGVGAAKLFWSVDNRNALAPWWYLAARPLIAHQHAAFLILHLAMGLIAGLSSYLLVQEALSARGRLFAVSLGILVSLFIVNVYRDDIVWTQVGALSCTLLSVWTFLRSQTVERNATTWRGLSLVLWLVALSTYTIQCGAVVAIFVLSLRRNIDTGELRPQKCFRAASMAIVDVMPYVAILLIYYMIWITSSAPQFSSVMTLQFSFSQMISSLISGIWHSDYLAFWVWARDSGPAINAGVFMLTVLAVAWILQFVREPRQLMLQWRDFFLLTAIGLSVVGPTVILESSSNIFVPGTRWRMVMQFWVPLAFCLVLLCTLKVLKLAEPWRGRIWRIGIACGAGGAVVLALGFNRTQVLYTRAETGFFDALKAVVSSDRASGAPFPRYYLIRLDASMPYFIGPNLETAYARTVLNSDVSFRTAPLPPFPYEGPGLVFQKDGLAIGNAKLIPYDQVDVLAWNGQSLSRVAVVGEEGAKRLRAVWAR